MKLYDKKENKCTYIEEYYKDSNGLAITICGNCYSYWIIINNDGAGRELYNSKDTADNNFNKAYKIASKRYNLIKVSDKEKLLEYIMEEQKPNNKRNRMGCSENWYEPFYAIKQTFTKEEIENMTDLEINHLYMLACNISDGLY